ncbi:MAG TPA: MBL fold metallo-hydrolase [Clostridiales bacterium]|nr:MBL fold metallo-hydrolase [Clostridiales bacterium]
MAKEKVFLLLKNNRIRYSNCYGILSDGGAVVIDPGKCDERIVSFLNDNADKQRFIIITHAHYDHLLGAEELRQKTGVPIAAAKGNMDDDMVIRLAPTRMFRREDGLTLKCDRELFDGEIFKVGDMDIKVLITPGHSKGSACFLINDNLFSGDTLFRGTVGATTFPGGDAAEMLESIRRLKKLDPAIKVFPGHEESTTIAEELMFNPFMRY